MSNIDSRHSNIEFIPAICPSCGGELRVPENHETIKCMYCGVDIFLASQKKNDNKPSLETITNLARHAFEGRNYIEAYRYYSMALEEAPDNAFIWAGKGVSSAWQSNISVSHFDEAIHCVQEAIRLGFRNNKDWLEFTVFSFADCIVAYTNLVITNLNKEYKEQLHILGGRRDVAGFCQMRIRLTDKLFLEYGKAIENSVYFIWETLPSPIIARKIRSIAMIFSKINLGWWNSLDDRFTPRSTSPKFLSSLLSMIMVHSSDPFGEKAQVEEMKQKEQELKEKRIESDPTWKRYYEETKFDIMIGSILNEIVQKYHPDHFYNGYKIESEYNPLEGSRIWLLIGMEGEILEHVSDYKKGGLLGIWLVYNPDGQVVGFEFYRRGYELQRCGSSEKELRASLFALEETDKQKQDSEKARLEAVKVRQQAMENEERLRKSRLLEWEQLPWWKQLFIERPK